MTYWRVTDRRGRDEGPAPGGAGTAPPGRVLRGLALAPTGLALWPSGALAQPFQQPNPPGASVPLPVAWLDFRALFLLFMIAACLAVGAWLWAVRRDFVRMVGPDPAAEKLALFREAQAGLPDGTIRAVLALLVVLVTLPAMVFFRALGLESSGELGTILGGILGFYFGSRSGGGEADAFRRQADAMRDQAEDQRQRAQAAEQARDAAICGHQQAVQAARQDASAATGLLAEAREKLAGLRSGLDLATRLLPPAQGQAARVLLDQVQQGLDLAGRVQAGDAAAIPEAAGEAADLVAQVLGTENPLTGILSDSVAGLRTGTAIAAMAGIGGPAGLLAGVAFGAIQALRKGNEYYERWKARIIDRPYTANLFPPEGLDGALCLAALRQARILGPILLAGLEEADPRRIPRAREACLAAQLPDAAARQRLEELAGCPLPLASEDEFASGLNELRRHMLDILIDSAEEPGAPQVVEAGGQRITIAPAAALRGTLDTLREELGAKGLDSALLLLTGLAQSAEMTPERMTALLDAVLPTVLRDAERAQADAVVAAP